MDSDLTRRRLLASAGLAVSAGAASVAGATGTGPAAQPSDRALDPPEVRWNRAYGPRTYNSAATLIETEDGNLAALGTTQNEQYGSDADWLFSVDGASGAGRWSRVFDGEGDSFSAEAVVEGDDGFVLLSGGLQESGIALREVTADGEQTWHETYEAPDDAEEANLVAFELQAVDDGYLVGAYLLRQSETTSADAATALVLKVDGEGTEQWRHRFFENRLSLVQSIVPDGDGYVASGLFQDPPETEDDQPPVKSVLFRFDESGSVDWQTELAETSEGETNQSSRIVDHAATGDGYLLVGATGSTMEPSPWVVATDESGSVRTSRTLDPDDSGQVLSLTSVAGDGDTAYVTGALTDRGSQESSAWLAALGTDAELNWSVNPARKQTNVFQDVVATSDGGIAVAGQSRTDDENADTPGEAWLVKLGGDAAPAAATTSEPTGATTPTETASSTPTPTASPTPTATPTAEPTPTATETPMATTGDGDAETTSGDGPGFGVGAALAALGGGALLRKAGLQSGADVDED